MSSYNQNSGYGAGVLQMVSSIIPTFGRIFVVFNSSDTKESYDRMRDIMRADTDGKVRFYTDLATAYAATTTQNNDVILLDAHSAHKVTAMLDVTKSRVHFIGMDGGGVRRFGQRTRIESTGAGAATDVAMVRNVGTGNTFRNIKFSCAFTAAENLSAVTDCGPNSYWENCCFQAQGTAHLTNELCASLICASGEGTYINCGIGQWQLKITSTGGQQLLFAAQAGVGSGKAGGNIFEGCMFECWTADTTHVFVRSASGSINSCPVEFNNCIMTTRGGASLQGVLAVAMYNHVSGGGRFDVGFPRIFGATNLAGQGTGDIYAYGPVGTGTDLVGLTCVTT